MVVLEKGFTCTSREWPNLVNLTRAKAEHRLSVDFPSAKCMVFAEEDFQGKSEEAYFESIALVVNNGLVTVAPRYFGQEPDMELIKKPKGKNYQDVVRDVREKIPSVKVVVRGRDGGQIWQSTDRNEHYLVLTVDNEKKVIETPRYVRVSAEAARKE